MRITRQLVGLMMMGCAVAGCGTETTALNLSNSEIGGLEKNPLGTYSDYGREIRFDEKDGLYHMDVYTGGLGGCDGGALLYAKPKLDEYMTRNDFKSYRVVKGEYSLHPLSKCELSVQFDR